MSKINTSLASVLQPNANEIPPENNVNPGIKNPGQIPQDPSQVPNATGAATEAKGYMDIAADYYQRTLQGAYDRYNSWMGVKEEVKIAPGTPPAPPDPVDAKAKEKISNMVGVFETGKVGGDPSALQDKDSGIISYGKHQCTLSSKESSLEKVLDRYMELAPQSENTKKLEEYMGAVRNKNESLRNNEEFKTLLKEAGKDPLMAQAQDEVFDKLYWKPAMQSAEKAGITSPLGCALLTDTTVNSGPDNTNIILNRTQAKLEGKEYTEQEFLQTFADERTKFLLTAAKNKEANGKQNDADMLKHVASDWRMDYWKGWIDDGNMDLKGKLKFTIYKQTIDGGE
ncbi:MAG TPA: chitosanase [Acidobacteriota bacterium]|jgi:hypothetical protein